MIHNFSFSITIHILNNKNGERLKNLKTFTLTNGMQFLKFEYT